MFVILESYIKAYASFTSSEIAAIESVSEVRTLKRKQHLLLAGDVSQHHTFVCSGCLRTYRVDAMGMEHVLGFATKNCWATEDLSVFPGLRSLDYMEAFEDTEIIQIKGENFRWLYTEVEGFRLLHYKLSLENTIREVERIYSLLSQQAEGRYRDFNERYPQLSLRLPVYMIASYLGISRETLSRVRGDRAPANVVRKGKPS